MSHKDNLQTIVAILFLSVLTSSTFGQTDVCEFTPDSKPTYTQLALTGTAKVNNGAVSGTLPSYTVDQPSITYMGMTATRNGGAGPNVLIEFTVSLYDTVPSADQVNISLTFQNLDATPVTSVSMEIDLGSGLEALWDTGVPSSADLRERSYVAYNSSSLATGISDTIHFLAAPAGPGGMNLPQGQNAYFASVYFIHAGTTYGIIMPDICLVRVVGIVENVVYEQGFTALTFFVMFFVGIGLAVFAVWLFLFTRRRRRDASVSPSKSDDKRLRERGRKIVMDAKAAMRRGANAIKDFSLIQWDDSLVFVLAMKDKLHMHREIDNLDILSTIHVDTDLETEQIDASVQASLLLVQGLRFNGDITKATEDKAYSNMQNQLKELDRKLDTEYKKELETVYVDIEAKNKEKLGDLLKKHKEQRHGAILVVKDLSEAEQKEMMDTLDQQQQTEENELTYKLALEQNEEAEKLRKEFAIRKRMGVKEIQQQFIDDVIKTGDLNAQKAEWLIKQHKEQQEEIHSKYDDEISRQRMNLEEKLARRRALALASEIQEDDHVESLNGMASIQIKLIEKMQKMKRALSSEEMEEYMNQARADLQAVKNKMDRERDAKQQEIFKKLSQAKRKSLSVTLSRHASELQEYLSKNKAQQTDGPVDPISYVDGLIKLKSRHRRELNTLENEIDEAHAKELEVMRDQLAENAKQELKTIEGNLVSKIKSEGVADEVIDKMLKAHEKTMNDLTAKQLANRRNQENKLKEELARRKREWEERRAKERKEQKDLREHEAEIVDKLLCSQISISEAERDRILKEHEKQMVKLENSLTLNKLRQKRMLEEKIAQKRERQMEELQGKQAKEMIKFRKTAENNGEEDDEETHRRELLLVKKHAEQRMALMQGMELDMEQELQQIHVEMTKERVLALKDQESRLGALITSLQLDKARQMAKIESQQKAINSLKANLMDDLNARGILSTPECERILDMHKQEQDRLNQKLDTTRAKQEKMLRAKLQERLQQREKSMLQAQDNEMRELMDKAANKTSAKIRRMILIHKQMVEMEKFKNKIDREVNQTLEDTKRDFEIQKQKLVQDQEMRFIAGLVKVGKLNRNELIDVLHMLFPGKTEEAVTEILNKIYEEDGTAPKVKMQRTQSTLAERIYMAQYSNPTPLHRRGSVMSLRSKSSASTKLTKKGSNMSLLSRDDSKRSRNQFGPQDETAKYLMRSHVKQQDDYSKYPTKNAYSSYDDDDDDDYGRRPKRNQYQSDEDEFRRSTKRNQYSLEREYPRSYDNYDDDDEYGNRKRTYDDDYEEDYIGKGIGSSQYQERADYSGRLPPLRNQGNATGKKKKKKLLKKLAHHSDDDDGL